MSALQSSEDSSPVDIDERIIANALIEPGTQRTWTNSRLYVQLRVYNSPRFNTESVVYRYPQTLLAAYIALGGLHRDMSQKKLNLFELAS